MAILLTILIAFNKGIVNFIVYKLTKGVTLYTIFSTHLTTPALSKINTCGKIGGQTELCFQAICAKAENVSKYEEKIATCYTIEEKNV